MKNEIITHIDDPKALEKLYRSDKNTFKSAFALLDSQYDEHVLVRFWRERLQEDSVEISWGTSKELLFVVAVSLVAGTAAKLPAILTIDPELFYSRNIGFIAFPFLMAYFVWKKNLQAKKLMTVGSLLLIALIFINLLPNNPKSDTLILACLHLPLFLWALLGFTFVGNRVKDTAKRLDFLRYNGDLIVMTTIILIAGGIMTGLTINLFSLIKLNIEHFYTEYIVIFGLAAAPIVGTYLTQTNPQLVGKVSPVIAKIFSPLVLVTLVAYLIAIIISGKDPYNDREFLLLFNALLIGVMALILFSVSETSRAQKSQISIIILLLLSVVTIIVNGIALSAIVFRISEWGITPNRMAVLGGNILIFINLLMVVYRLFKVIAKSKEIEAVEKSITDFLPIYSVWTIIVTFVFPLIFNFK